MADIMTFPDTVEEFMEQYKITDTEQIYTNGAELVPIFRMRQWFDHKPERKTGKAIVKSTGYRGYWACDQCGTEIKHTDNFCRHCGAKLEGVEECQR